MELPPVADAAGMRWIRQLACRAYWTAQEGRPGPVHLNLPLREPLILDAPLPAEPDGDPAFTGRRHHRPWVGRDGAGPFREPPSAPPRTAPGRTLIVAGRVESDPRLAVAIAECAQRLEAPVLADPLSGARSGPDAIATYDLLLRDPQIATTLAPERVIRVGDLPTSKPLRAWLAGLDPEVGQTVLDPHGSWQDPDAVADETWAGDPLAALRALGPQTRLTGSAWHEHWRRLDAAATIALEAGLQDGPDLSEPRVSRILGERLGPEATLFAASSMPIRDLELYLPAGRPLPRILANRGANGIDGTVSSAFGVAAAEPGRPVVLLIGDVALLHDLGGLLAARRLGLALTIVAVNNDGGGIFHFLPVSGEGDAFTEHIATPHGLSLERVAALFEFGYASPRSSAELTRALDDAVGAATTTLIEVRTDRGANLAEHRGLAERGLAAARAALV